MENLSTNLNKNILSKINWWFIGLILVIVSFNYQIIFQGKINFYSDIIVQYIPWAKVLADHIRNFTLPFWNSFVGMGFPLISEPQVGSFYPINWIVYLLLPFSMGYSFIYILHIFLGAMFMWLYLRELGLGNPAKFIGSISFIFSSFFVAHTCHQSIILTGIWMPLALLFLEKGIKQPKFLGLFGLVCFMQGAAGHPHVFMMSMCLYGLFTVRIITINIKRILLIAIIYLLIGGSLLTVYYPVWKQSKEIIRNDRKYMDNYLRNWGSFKLEYSALYLLPNFFGHSNIEERSDIWINNFSYTEKSPYAGIVIIVFAIIALYEIKKRIIIFFIVAICASYLFMLGYYSPLYGLIKIIPGIESMRVLSRFMYILNFSLIVLAAFGINSVMDNKKRNFIRYKKLASILTSSIFLIIILFLAMSFKFFNDNWLQVIFLILATPFIILSHKLNKIFVAVFLAGIVVLDLANFGLANAPPKLKIDKVFEPPALYSHLKHDSDIFRIATDRRTLISKAQDAKNSFAVNSNMLWGIASLDFYSPMANRESQYLKRIVQQFKDYSKLLGFFNIKYIISETVLTHNDWELKAKSGGFALYENSGYLPPVFTLKKIILTPGNQNYWKYLADPSLFDQRIGFVEKNNTPQIPQEYKGLIRNSELLTKNNNEYEWLVDCDDNTFAVFSEKWHENWEVFIDGTASSIYKVNGLLMGIRISKGIHKIKFEFSNSWLYPLLLISIISIVSLISFYFIYSKGNFYNPSKPTAPKRYLS